MFSFLRRLESEKSVFAYLYLNVDLSNKYSYKTFSLKCSSKLVDILVSNEKEFDMNTKVTIAVVIVISAIALFARISS